MNVIMAAFLFFIAAFIVEGILRGMGRFFGLFTTVQEGTCRVYILFGKVIGILDEPGLHILPTKLGLNAFVVNFLGSCRIIDMRLDQEYLRSEPVNSEEGAPMGIGIWYEMWISDPVAYLFKNTDPRGSLRANVSNSTVRCLSNMPLAEMLETRHNMSQAVRAEVSTKSQAWGYQLGSVYIRKVHFRDAGMIRQIEEKVVNRLRQVTSAIKQSGANQVSVITSSAEREAAVELAKAAVIRPATLRQMFQEVAGVPAVSEALFQILETQRIMASNARLMLLPTGPHARALSTLLAAESTERPLPKPEVRREFTRGGPPPLADPAKA
jgi:regulator of protease activity HflC (stomatin/prohibitin superfamily)